MVHKQRQPSLCGSKDNKTDERLQLRIALACQRSVAATVSRVNIIRGKPLQFDCRVAELIP
ncbi:MAG: hypothetical protein QOC76_5706 [Mycobacterium sp.]|jgi:hypothetical protein|nr:hypothetical protein [Mycobacterium sp.]